MQLVLISGLSGSGKSVALNVMEDCGHYVVDNLPSALLPQLVTHLRGSGYQRIADTTYRVLTLTVPLIINDAWQEVA